MKIRINEYSSKAFEFSRAYLKYWAPEWTTTPMHRLVSPAFWKTLNDGDLDSEEYHIVFNMDRFDAEECLIVERYYFTHLGRITNNANRGRIFTELGPAGVVFRRTRKSSTNVNANASTKKNGGKRSPASPSQRRRPNRNMALMIMSRRKSRRSSSRRSRSSRHTSGKHNMQ